MANEPSAAESNPPPAVEPSSQRSRGSLRNLLGFCILLGLFSFALWGSWHIRPGRINHGDPLDSPSEPSKASLLERGKVSPAEILARGDTAVRQLRIAEAVAHYKDFLATGAIQSAEIAYRLGLCSESAGQLDDAIVSYRQAIAGSPSASLTFACHLAMARCLMRQNSPVEARYLLYPFLFDERRHQLLPQALITDACYLAALALACEDAIPGANQISQPTPVSSLSVPLEIRPYFDEIATRPPAQVIAKEVPIPVPLVVQKRSKNEPALVVSAEQTELPADDLFTQLAAGGGWKTAWSPGAKKALTARSLQLHLHNWELRDVLEQGADYLGLVCQIDGDLVRFSTSTELDSGQAKALRRGMTQRFLQAALRADPTHPYAAAASLELGNIESAQSRWSEAAFWYNRLIREATHSSYVAESYFNLARVHIAKGDVVQARKTYFRVIDQSPGHELALRASIQIGQLHLQEDNAGQAIEQLRRAQAMALRSRYHPLAALALTAAYLHHGDLEAARRTLAQSRANLQQESYLPTAAFLDRYLQYRLAKEARDGIRVQRDTSELIGALWQNKDKTVLDVYGQWLIAKAYCELDYLEPAERMLRNCRANAHGPFKACVEYSLADTLAKRDQRAEAVQLFSKWANAESPYRGRSQYQLAKFDLEEKRYKECATACQKLWTERSFPDQTALLNLWGAALEGNGELAKAVDCYSGKAPQ